MEKEGGVIKSVCAGQRGFHRSGDGQTQKGSLAEGPACTKYGRLKKDCMFGNNFSNFI